MTSDYYGRDKHPYMQPGSGRFGEYVYSLIPADSLAQCDSAIELGAGMGRFSRPLARRFGRVTLVEPVKEYADRLRQAFSNETVQVVCADAEDAMAGYQPDGCPAVFGFHLMHHLTEAQRAAIYGFIHRAGAVGVFVEPNVWNPLILLQILLRRDMSFAQETQYLKLTRRRYERELQSSGLVLTGFRRICLLPPVVARCVLRAGLRRAARAAEALCRTAPFLGSYQLVTCEARR